MSATRKKSPASETAPVILPRSEHGISRTRIDDNTLKVLYRLHRNGHLAYLVGGGVRDLLLGRTPKDFDIGTDATPSQVRKLFRNCFLVGRRFRLAHVRFGRDDVLEVATFRRQPEADEIPDEVGDDDFYAQNQFGTPCEDAFRRDFTINALFYNIADFSILDHVGGLEDLAARRLRMIGDPLERFAEDPVRMLRALEFGARLSFAVDPAILDGIVAQAPRIAEAAPARVREEILELFRHGVGDTVLAQAQQLGLLAPMTGGYEADPVTFRLLGLLNEEFRRKRAVDEGLLLAALHLTRFWDKCPVRAALPVSEVLQSAGHLVAPYAGHFHLSHGLRHQARELLLGCYRFARGPGQRGQKRFLHHASAAPALELFRLWVKASDGDTALLATWEKALHTGHEPAEHPPRQTNHRRRRRPRRRAPRPA